MALNVFAGQFQIGTGAAASTVAVTGVGFQPKVVLFSWSGRTANGQAEGDHKFGTGYMVSGSDRGGTTSQSDHSPTTMAADCQVYDDACIKLLTTAGGVDGAADFSAFGSDGFTVVIDDQFAADYIINYIAIGGSDLTNVESQTISRTIAAGTGNANITSYSFQPDALLFYAASVNAANSTAGWSNFSFGAVDTAFANAVLAGASQDAIGTSATMSYCRAGDCVAGVSTDSVVLRGNVTAWLSNGFTINWAEVGVDVQAIRVLAFKGGRWKVGDILSQTGTNNTGETGVGFQPKGLVFGSANAAQSASDTTTAHDQRSLGVTDGTRQNFVSIIDKDNAGTADIGVSQNSTGFYGNQSTAATVAIEGVAGIVSMDSDGFTFAHSDADPSQCFIWYLAVGDTPSSGYTLSADAGSYAFTGTAATPRAARKVAADAGSYAISGTAATPRKGFPLSAAAGSYAITGTDAAVRRAAQIAAGAGAYALSGTAATLKKAYPLAAEAGSYLISGTASGLRMAWLVGAGVGTYTISGTAAGARRDARVTAGAGSYSLSGTDATLTYFTVGAFTLVAEAGAYVLSGTAASVLARRFVAAGAGSYAVSGQAASLLRGARIALEAGSYAISGTAAALLDHRRALAEAGVYTLSGTAAGALFSRLVVAGQGAYTYTGADATLVYVPTGFTLVAESGSYVLSGFASALEHFIPPLGALPAGRPAAGPTRASTAATVRSPGPPTTRYAGSPTARRGSFNTRRR